jgi:hypothetical protein
MSFLRHEQIYHPMKGYYTGSDYYKPPPFSSSDESAASYSSASCTPALLVSASPTVIHLRLLWPTCQQLLAGFIGKLVIVLLFVHAP